MGGEADFYWRESGVPADETSAVDSLLTGGLSAASPHDGDESPEEAPPLPAVSGFWRRLLAFLLDGLLLGAVGQAIGWAFAPFWFRVGPYGRIVGLIVALTYFGVLDSRLGGGRTLGKRAMRIALRTGANEQLSVGRSLLRTSIWLAPATLNGWALPVLANPILQSLSSVILFGIGGAIVFTMVFNRRSRQGLHDLLTGTYVVRTRGLGTTAFPVASRLQWVVSAVLVAVSLIAALAAPFVTPALYRSTGLAGIMPLYETLSRESRYFSAGVNEQTYFSAKGNQRVLGVTVWYKGRPSRSEAEATMVDVARVTLRLVPDVERFDLVRIEVSSAYDLGIATGYVRIGDGETPDTWRDRVEKAASQ